MRIMINMWEWFEKHINAFLATPDSRIVVRASPTPEDREIIPFARTDVPYLGEDHDALIRQAEQLFDDDLNRYKWLMAVLRLRTSVRTGWIIEKGNKAKPNWGLTHSVS
jgi:hypothetical protein